MQFERVFRRRTHVALALVLGASTLGVLGCKDDKTTTAPIVPYLVQVSPVNSNLAVGGTQQLTATVKDFYNNTLSTPVTWESSIPSVATVSATGLVTMVKAGSTTIVARVTPGNGQAYGTAVVSSPSTVASLAIAPIPTTLAIPLTLQLNAQALDANGGQLLPADGITYSSSAPTIATVSKTGVVTAVAAGSAVITASSGGKSATVTVNAIVFTPINSISIAPYISTVANGGTVQLTATSKDVTGAAIANKTLTWSSSNTAVATVSQTGLVTVVGAGNAVISAAGEGKVGVAAVSTTAITSTPLINGTPLTGVAGTNGSTINYNFVVPPGTTSFTIRLAGGTGDADLFLYAPSVTAFSRANATCISENDVGITEVCTVTGAAVVPGIWQIQLLGFSAYGSWTFTATTTP